MKYVYTALFQLLFFSLTLSDQIYKTHTTSDQNMKSNVMFRSSLNKYSKMDLSPNKLLIFSYSVLNFYNLTDHIYLWFISIFSKNCCFSSMYKSSNIFKYQYVLRKYSMFRVIVLRTAH